MHGSGKILRIMRIKTLLTIGLLLSSVFTGVARADTGMGSGTPLIMQHPFYFGVMTGYGNTDWSRLVAQDSETSNATPTAASGSGAIVGALVGYQLTQYIAIEAQYVHYPTSSVTLLLNPVIYPGITNSQFNSTTNYYAIMPKIAAPFDHDQFEVFGTLGAALVTRSDELTNNHDYRPTFGFGVSNIQYAHWNFTVAFNYTPGTGVASQNAAAQYIPYLYAGEFIITYRI
jgi:OmpA-like transmembrane domain